MFFIWGRTATQREFWCGKIKLKDHLEDIGVDVKIILKSVLKK
jgi:hypothetical protein